MTIHHWRVRGGMFWRSPDGKIMRRGEEEFYATEEEACWSPEMTNRLERIPPPAEAKPPPPQQPKKKQRDRRTTAYDAPPSDKAV